MTSHPIISNLRIYCCENFPVMDFLLWLYSKYVSPCGGVHTRMSCFVFYVTKHIHDECVGFRPGYKRAPFKVQFHLVESRRT